MSNVKIDKKPDKNIFICYIRRKASSHLKSLFIILNQVNSYVKNCLGLKCLTVIHFNENNNVKKVQRHGIIFSTL